MQSTNEDRKSQQGNDYQEKLLILFLLTKDDILIICLTLFSAPSLLPTLAALDLSQQVDGNLAEAGVFQVQYWPMKAEN